MFDILGFGRSSRPAFDQTNTISAETKFVESIEDWRIAVELHTQFYLVGHGFGAYLATLYTMRYGQFIKKLILLDPWGFNPKPDENQLNLSTPFWIKMIAYITQTWTSFSAFRYFGPLGKHNWLFDGQSSGCSRFTAPETLRTAMETPRPTRLFQWEVQHCLRISISCQCPTSQVESSFVVGNEWLSHFST